MFSMYFMQQAARLTQRLSVVTIYLNLKPSIRIYTYVRRKYGIAQCFTYVDIVCKFMCEHNGQNIVQNGKY
jgi:hypothetical protein